MESNIHGELEKNGIYLLCTSITSTYSKKYQDIPLEKQVVLYYKQVYLNPFYPSKFHNYEYFHHTQILFEDQLQFDCQTLHPPYVHRWLQKKYTYYSKHSVSTLNNITSYFIYLFQHFFHEISILENVSAKTALLVNQNNLLSIRTQNFT